MCTRPCLVVPLTYKLWCRVTSRTSTPTSSPASQTRRYAALEVLQLRDVHTMVQTIDVRETESAVQLTTRKKGASPTAVHSAFVTSAIRPRSGPRRAAGVTATLAKRGYRPDLRKVSIPPSLPFRLHLCSLSPRRHERTRRYDEDHTRYAPSRARWTAARHYESWVWTCCARLRGLVRRTINTLAGYGPCRYRVPFDARRGCPTLWHSHSFHLSLFFQHRTAYPDLY